MISQPDLATFKALVETTLHQDDYPRAEGVEDGILVYSGPALIEAAASPTEASAVEAEIARGLADGPGVIAVTGLVEDDIVDRASAVAETLITQERATGQGGGDHFAKPGANERLWNALEKMAVADPETFIDYHGNPAIDLIARSWLGPAYQMTTQINVINPGGEAQAPHRDYHLGFMAEELALRFPLHAHRLSPVLTLQGAIAHCDMAVEAGPTMLLPHSQTYELGYLAWRRPEFVDYFNQHHVQRPLAKGDAVFFNPAVFHAGGHNRTTDVRRMANLLQISSAMGRAMETVDRRRMTEALYPTLLARHRQGDQAVLAAAIAASAEGYPFPTNLDLDPPVDGPTPASQQDVVRKALADGDSPTVVAQALQAYEDRHQSTHR